ncbi:MAG: lysylphosphatidylglycerol synthase transmembrane domain-containing protein [Anaerolineae bacterium]
MLKRWQFWLGAGISALFLVIALRNLHLGNVWAEMRAARYGWILPGVAVYFLGVWARTWRWDYLLRPLKRIPLRRLFPVVVIGYMGNNVYPARAGEVIRAYVLRRREGVSIGASLATIVVERVFDGLVMLIFVFIGLPFTPMPGWLQGMVIAASLLFFGALGLFMTLAIKIEWAEVAYGWAIDRVVPARFRVPVRGFADRFMTGLHSLRSGRGVLMIFVTSIVIWLAETVKYWFVMHAFDFSVPFWVLMLMNGIVNLATTIPSSPGYVGTFDAPGIEILSIFGVERSLAAGYTLVLHAALWLPITLLGFWYMGRESISWRDFGQAEKSLVQQPG